MFKVNFVFMLFLCVLLDYWRLRVLRKIPLGMELQLVQSNISFEPIRPLL